VMDSYTREIVGWSIGLHHSAQLVIDALEDARKKRETPNIFHSDQGSEYDSVSCKAWLLAHQVLPSQSHKAHPWENGHQESFFGRFNAELGNLNRFETLDQVIEAIHHQLHYYNSKRFHTALRMTPLQKYQNANQVSLTA
jgi:putative transposase